MTVRILYAEEPALDDLPPRVWTPDLILDRVTFGLRYAIRSTASVGPRCYGNAMPDIVREFDDYVRRWDANDLEDWMQAIEAVAARRFTALEASLAEEALKWPMRYLADAPLPRDALWVKALADAAGFEIEGLLKRRRRHADSMVERRSREMPDIIRIYEGEPEAVAAKIAAWINPKLAKTRAIGERKRLWHAAKIRFARELKQAGPNGEPAIERITVVRRQDVIEGLNFTRTHLYRRLGQATEAIATALQADGVPVR